MNEINLNNIKVAMRSCIPENNYVGNWNVMARKAPNATKNQLLITIARQDPLFEKDYYVDDKLTLRTVMQALKDGKHPRDLVKHLRRRI